MKIKTIMLLTVIAGLLYVGNNPDILKVYLKSEEIQSKKEKPLLLNSIKENDESHDQEEDVNVEVKVDAVEKEENISPIAVGKSINIKTKNIRKKAKPKMSKKQINTTGWNKKSFDEKDVRKRKFTNKDVWEILDILEKVQANLS